MEVVEQQQQQLTDKKLLSVTEVATLHKISRVAVIYAIRDGRLPAMRVGEKNWAIRTVDACAWHPREYRRTSKKNMPLKTRTKRLA